jgi:hypothetical protein
MQKEKTINNQDASQQQTLERKNHSLLSVKDLPTLTFGAAEKQQRGPE